MTTIVLLPGMDGSGILLDDFQSALGSKTLVVSYPKDQVLNYEQLVSLVMSELPTDEPYIILGESFSGPIAINIASQDLPALKAVVLVCTFARMRPKRAPRFLSAIFALFPFWRLPVSVGAARLFGRFDSPALRSKLLLAIKGVSPAVWRSRMRSILDVDVTPQLQRIKVPLLYLRAVDDRVVPTVASELILRIKPDVMMQILDGPHALLQTNPMACAAAIRRFAQQANIEL